MAPTSNPPPRRSGPLRSALRWLMAAGVGAAVTLGLFLAMSAVVDGTSILERMFRIFPLHRTELSTSDACAEEGSPLADAVTIEGSVGTLGAEGFRPRAQAEVTGSNAIADDIRVEVAGDGRFRFVTSFRSDAPSPCGDPAPATGGDRQELRFRAPGCTERRVPVTRAWVDHRVLLDCGPEATPRKPRS